MYAMPADQQRIDALRKGITAASDEGYVTIRVADLRWLLDQAGAGRPEARVADARDLATEAPTAFDLDKDLIDDRDDE